MNYILTDKEPKLPLKYFEDISAIPHGSYNEKAISAFIADTAAKLGLYARVMNICRHCCCRLMWIW